ncbi:MAG: DegT/DnrJ/EryC1/StrS family aminotransferase [Ilumatobacter sp.]|uniref:DegT/DnrJ/EryC1/StrS family aminotransferase n=2 Tax=Ilumatobacter sp. TaxID=1967498 RepID=UPI00329906BC
MSIERIHLSAPDVGPLERDALLRAFDSGWIAPVGPELTAFESDLAALTGWPGSVALSSGTAALHLALLAVGVGDGDDVLVPTATFVASANAVRYVNARPCFVDSETTSWNISPDLLEVELDERARRGELPAAVMVVDLYGQCADYDRIVPLCRRYEVPIIEDAAEALGSTHGGRAAGTLGDVGVFSFNGNKIVTTSGGGALIAPSTDTADRARHLATQSRVAARHFEHDGVGYNYRLSNLLAAMGRAQLARLTDMIRRRREISDRYRAAFAHDEGITFMPFAPWGDWNGWLTCATFTDVRRRDLVIQALDAADIESRPLWKPMHLQAPFASAPGRLDGTSEDIFDRGICLPSGSGLGGADLERVIETMTRALSSG